MRRWLGAAALAASLPCAAADGRIDIELFLARDGTPTVRYALPEGRRTVRLKADPGEGRHELARTAWRHDERCLAIRGSTVHVLAPDCGPHEFRLGWDGRIVDRMYPPVVRMRNGGVLVFTDYLQPDAAEAAAVGWTVRAPTDGVAIAGGEKTRGTLELPESFPGADARGWIYLGPDRFREEKAARVMVDEGVPAAIEREMIAVAPALMESYGRRLGARPAERPTLYLSWDGQQYPGRSVKADVVPGFVVRFGLSGRDWAQSDAQQLAQFRALVAHELAHLWNGGVFQPAPWAAPWISEGNAELLSVAALLDAGALDAEGAAERLGRAFNECAIAAGDRAWVAMWERGRGTTPYTCGLAMHFAAVAAARAARPDLDAFAAWRAIWSRWPRYYEAVVQQYLADIGAHEAAAAFHELLTQPGAGLVRSLLRLYGAAGVRISPAGEPSAPMRAALRSAAGAGLMASDCNGGVSLITLDDHLLTADIPCANLRSGMKLRYLEGVDLVARTREAVESARAACRDRGKARLGTLDGVEVAVPCRESTVPDVASLVQFDARQVAAVLLAPPPRPSPKGEGRP